MAIVEDVYRKHKPKAFAADRQPSSFEVWSWFFMRLSGVVLLFLVLIHVFIVHVMEAGVDRVDFAFVSQRWDNVGWKTFDWMMLLLALLHGVNGLRIVIDDYVRSAGTRTAIKGTLYTIGVLLLIMGTAVIVEFDPAAT